MSGSRRATAVRATSRRSIGASANASVPARACVMSLMSSANRRSFAGPARSTEISTRTCCSAASGSGTSGRASVWTARFNVDSGPRSSCAAIARNSSRARNAARARSNRRAFSIDTTIWRASRSASSRSARVNERRADAVNPIAPTTASRPSRGAASRMPASAMAACPARTSAGHTGGAGSTACDATSGGSPNTSIAAASPNVAIATCTTASRALRMSIDASSRDASTSRVFPATTRSRSVTSRKLHTRPTIANATRCGRE